MYAVLTRDFELGEIWGEPLACRRNETSSEAVNVIQTNIGAFRRHCTVNRICLDVPRQEHLSKCTRPGVSRWLGPTEELRKYHVLLAEEGSPRSKYFGNHCIVRRRQDCMGTSV